MANNRSGRGKAKAKGTSRKGDGVEALIDVGKRAVGRYATYASNVGRQLSEGDLSLSRWIDSYAKVWKGLAEDMQEVANVMLKKAAK